MITTQQTNKSQSKNTVTKSNISRPTPTVTKSSHSPQRWSTYARNARPTNRLSSENFLKHRIEAPKQTIADLKKLVKKDEIPVRVFSLWGLEEIWINMTVIEFKNDIIIIDAGLEFASYDMHGIDYIIPDIAYLVQKKVNIRGIFITHGHLDHIWAIKHIIWDLNYPMVYTTPLALWLIKKNLTEKDNKLLKYKLINPDVDLIKAGIFTIEAFRVNHSIPESMGFAVHTPKGMIVHSGDFKIDFIPAIDRPADLGKISRIWTEWVKLYMWESTNARRAGHTPSEKIIWENIATIINKHNRQRLVVSLFASNIGRIIQIIESAARQNRTIFLAGRSMVNNVQLCQELGYLNVPRDMIRQMSADIEQMPDERVLVLCTGSQWEENSALVRMADKTFKDFFLRPWDCVILSAHTIAGNEKAVGSLMNKLVDLDIDLVDDPHLDLHTSGHAYQEDMKEMMALLKPEYFIPVHWELVMRNAHKKVALDMRIPEEKVLMPKNWQLIEMFDEAVLLSEKKLKVDTIVIDGKGEWHLSWEYVVKARNIMAQDGVVALIFKIDNKTHELVWNLQIESRGFVYSSEVKAIHTKIVEFAKSLYNQNLKKRMDIKTNLKAIREALGDEITKIIGRIPMLMLTWVYINREAISGESTGEDPIIWMTLEEQGYED